MYWHGMLAGESHTLGSRPTDGRSYIYLFLAMTGKRLDIRLFTAPLIHHGLGLGAAASAQSAPRLATSHEPVNTRYRAKVRDDMISILENRL
jgi:hypothetical protein